MEANNCIHYESRANSGNRNVWDEPPERDTHLVERDTHLACVHTNGYDDYFYSYKDAKAAFDDMVGYYGCARMYFKKAGIQEDSDGDCVENHGPFPR